jgi:hypothetical protein
VTSKFTYKELLIPHLYDSKGKYCSPKLSNERFLQKLDKDLYEFLINQRNNGISFSESIYKIMNDTVINNCVVCGKPTKYRSFNSGYDRTCHSDNCLKTSYGINPHIPTIEERQMISKRMITDNPMYNKDIQTKRLNSCIKKYGSDPLHWEKTKLKALSVRYDANGSFSHYKGFFKAKSYIRPDGSIIKVQGYEPLALDYLYAKYEMNDIVICGRLHMFYYHVDNNKRRYFPDIFIKSENRYVEVKSPYLFETYKDINEQKRQSVMDKGFNYSFFIFDRNKQLQIL